MQMMKRLRIAPGKKLRLADHDPAATPGIKSKRPADAAVAKAITRISKLQYRLYAENRRALLVVLQGIDAAGKDGTIRHVMTGLNPQGCSVTSFKAPSAEELDHDFLWRIHRVVPSRGDIGIFNRSHYEDIIVPRVHMNAPAKQWKARCRQINEFEKYLSENDVVVLKFFLHISKDEQKRRLQQRLEDPSRHWKSNPMDFTEREHWADYMKAFEGMLADCSTPWAPWHLIPADHKWYRNYAVSQILQERLEEMDPKLPNTKLDPKKIKLD
jgi:PPK2 family polyphosphate:nucleotide phosphotransferase